MARIRTLKPEFWKHEGLSALPEPTHMLAAALLNYADDEGYFNANPALIKAECSPLREPSVSIHDSLQLLSSEGYLQFGIGPNGRRYGRIVHFREHQTISRPTLSKIKPLEIDWEDSTQTHGVLHEDSTAEQGTGNREQGEDLLRKSCPAEPDARQVLDHLNERTGSKFQPSKTSLQNINARLSEGHSVDDLCAVVDFKSWEWGEPTMRQYLRPQTLFAPGKFPGYLAAARSPPPQYSETTRQNITALREWANGTQ